MRIVVNESPKSGGSWVVSMLGDALDLPKRDIYVRDDYAAFDVWKHPWYEGASRLAMTDSCVVKSHELPGSPLLKFPARSVHLVRDGRDVVVSKYFYERDFCVANGIYQKFDVPFDDYVTLTASEWRDYVVSWVKIGATCYKYEEFLRDPGDALKALLSDLGIEFRTERIAEAVEKNSKERFSRRLDKTFRSNTFVRKAIAGDWRNHFDDSHTDGFKSVAGHALIDLGYEQDLRW
jgi:hypothetical protein